MLAKFLLELLAMAFECYYKEAFCTIQEIAKLQIGSKGF